VSAPQRPAFAPQKSGRVWTVPRASVPLAFVGISALGLRHRGSGRVNSGRSCDRRAQVAWPDKPVRIIVPFAAGGGTDLVARPGAEKLSQAFRQQFIAENRGGASGLIGAQAVAKSPPDGYTVLAAASSIITVPLLRKAPYDHTNFQAVGRLGDIVCRSQPSVGAATFKEVIDYAKKNPGKMAFGSSGTGTRAAHATVSIFCTFPSRRCR